MRLLVLIITFLLLPSLASAGEILISSAAGMMEFIKEVGKEFERRTGKEVVFNFSSSGKIAKQIEAGAPTDLFISASKFWIDYLKRMGLIEKETAIPFASTELVVVAPKGSKLNSLLEAETVAVGNKFAPVGAYALESLKRLGLYEKLKSRLIYAPNVRQITLWVMSGNADAGIIYYSDFVKYRKKLKPLKVLPENSHSPIEFFAACTGSSLKECREFEEFLKELPDEVYEKYGFKKVK
ncbi:molybdate ABC transporter substrate-binding protein [Thermovibrio sp.]